MSKEGNAKYVTGVLDWAKALLDWLSQQNLAELAAEAKAIYDACAAALSDGKLTFVEIAGITLKVLSLLGKLKLAGIETP